MALLFDLIQKDFFLSGYPTMLVGPPESLWSSGRLCDQFLLKGFKKKKEEEEVVVCCRLSIYFSASLFLNGGNFDVIHHGCVGLLLFR
jgi:hypothetical protein